MKKYGYTIAFVAVCATVLIVLLKAPPVKTPRLPENETHREHKKYEACPQCHLPGGAGPTMAADHMKEGKLLPDHMKCYMCHRLKNQ